MWIRVFFLSSADFFYKIKFFETILPGISSKLQTVWTQTRPLILVQTACRGYQQTTLAYKELKKMGENPCLLSQLINFLHAGKCCMFFCCPLIFFFSKLTFSKKIFREYHQSVKQFGPG